MPFENMPPSIANVEFVKLTHNDVVYYLLVTTSVIYEYTELIFPEDVDRGYIESHGVKQEYYKPLTLSHNVLMAPSGCFPTSRGLFVDRDVKAGTFLTLALTKKRQGQGQGQGGGGAGAGVENPSFHVMGVNGESRDVIGQDQMIPLSAINDNSNPNSQFVSYTPFEFSKMMMHQSLQDELCHIGMPEIVRAVQMHPTYEKYGEFAYHIANLKQRVTSDAKYDDIIFSFLTKNDFEVCVCQTLYPLNRGQELTVNYNWSNAEWREADGEMKSAPTYARLYDQEREEYFATQIIRRTQSSIHDEKWALKDLRHNLYTMSKEEYKFAKYTKGRTLPFILEFRDDPLVATPLVTEKKKKKKTKKKTKKKRKLPQETSLQSLKKSKNHGDLLKSDAYLNFSLLTTDQVDVIKKSLKSVKGLMSQSVGISQSIDERKLGDGLRRQISFTKLPDDTQTVLNNALTVQLQNFLMGVLDYEFEIVLPTILCSLPGCHEQNLHIDFKTDFLAKGRCHSAIIAIDERPISFLKDAGDINSKNYISLSPGELFLFDGEVVHAGGKNASNRVAKFGIHVYVIEKTILQSYRCQTKLVDELDYTIFI